MLAEEHREVIEALHELAPRQREVLVLRYWSNLSEAEIARTLDISQGTVKSTASRALVALEKAMHGAPHRPRGRRSDEHHDTVRHRGAAARRPDRPRRAGPPRGPGSAGHRSSRCGRAGSHRGCCWRPPRWCCSCSASSSRASGGRRALGPDRAEARRSRSVELPPSDVGRDWKADDLSTPARLDLDGDGTKEKVDLPRRADRGARRPHPACRRR